MDLSILIPVYNEATTVREAVERAKRSVPRGISAEVIVIDDASTDGSRAALDGIEGISVIRLPARRGKGGALKVGLARATGKLVLFQDADLEYSPEDYPALLAPVLTGAARVVFGSRALVANRRNRLYALGASCITGLFNAKFRTRITDIATCYKLFPRELIPDLLDAPEDDFAFDVFRLTLAIARRGIAITEVPVRYSPRTRRNGKKLNFRDGLRILLLLLREPAKNR